MLEAITSPITALKLRWLLQLLTPKSSSSNCQYFFLTDFYKDKKLLEKVVINSLHLGNSWAERIKKKKIPLWWRIYCVLNGPLSRSMTRKGLKKRFSFDLCCILINQKSFAFNKASSCPRHKNCLKNICPWKKNASFQPGSSPAPRHPEALSLLLSLSGSIKHPGLGKYHIEDCTYTFHKVF